MKHHPRTCDPARKIHYYAPLPERGDDRPIRNGDRCECGQETLTPPDSWDQYRPRVRHAS